MKAATTDFSRSQMLLGSEAMERLATVRVILFGVGGVGSWAAECLVRTGLRRLTIVDFDDVAPSNINRQLPATTDTIGRQKVDVMRQHLLTINPEAEITAINGLYSPDSAAQFDLDSFDYVIDAIDSVRDKALLILNATRSRCRLFSSMGAALRTDPTRVAVANFYDVKTCRLAAALRQRFKRMEQFPAHKFKVVYSTEPPVVTRTASDNDDSGTSPINKRVINGSLMQVTAAFGLTLASLVINDIAKG